MSTPANPDDLIAWLRAQLDEDETWAERVITAEVQEARAAGVDLTRDEFLTDGGGDWQRWVLAEVDAKRRILAALDLTSCPCARAQRCVIHDSSAGPPEFAVQRYVDPATEMILSALALPYADRPGYREEWRPA